MCKKLYVIHPCLFPGGGFLLSHIEFYFTKMVRQKISRNYRIWAQPYNRSIKLANCHQTPWSNVAGVVFLCVVLGFRVLNYKWSLLVSERVISWFVWMMMMNKKRGNGKKVGSGVWGGDYVWYERKNKLLLVLGYSWMKRKALSGQLAVRIIAWF